MEQCCVVKDQVSARREGTSVPALWLQDGSLNFAY